MKVIFLDFDGVLVTARSLKQRSGRRAVGDERCVAVLNQILKATGADIVVSSAWRFCGLNEIRLILELWGVDGRVIGITPDRTVLEGLVYKGAVRGEEIQQWLDENDPEAEFIIIDDEADMAHLKHKLVKTEFSSGLTAQHVQQAVELMRRSAPAGKEK